jgi:membrane protease YdiL (CAAX protease family)
MSAVLVSIIYGWLRLATGSVWPTSLAHSTGNSTAGPLLAVLGVGLIRGRRQTVQH